VKVVSVSELENAMGQIPAREPVVSKYLPGVEGTIKGTIIHEVLRGRDASTVLKEYGEYSEEHVRQCEEIVAKFLSSDLMKRVKRSYCELPFVVTIEGKPVTGKIDRLCELDDGTWVAIDYKSVVSSDCANVVEEYALSVSIYIEAAQQLICGKCMKGVIYFTESGGFGIVV
jgi:ATP-dependent exoDNAse (exonuclease V) beta subunit